MSCVQKGLTCHYNRRSKREIPLNRLWPSAIFLGNTSSFFHCYTFSLAINVSQPPKCMKYNIFLVICKMLFTFKPTTHFKPYTQRLRSNRFIFMTIPLTIGPACQSFRVTYRDHDCHLILENNGMPGDAHFLIRFSLFCFEMMSLKLSIMSCK